MLFRRLFFSAILFLYIQASFSQIEKIDSLKKVLLTAKEDTSKVNAFFSLSKKLIVSGNFEEAIKNITQAKQLAERLYFKKGIANAYTYLGIIYWDKGDYPEALRNYFTALRMYEDQHNKKGTATIYNNIGLIYSYQHNYDQALQNQLEALKIRKEINDKSGMANSYNNIGMLYDDKKNYEEDLKNYFSSVEIKKELRDMNGISYSYGNIGVIYKEQKNYSEALKYYRSSLEIQMQTGDKYAIATSNNNIGVIYIKLRKFNEAKNYLNIGLQLYKTMGSKEGLKNAYNAFTELDSTQGNYSKAFEDYKMNVLYKDSLINEENTKKTVQTQMLYEFDKKEAAQAAERQRQETVAATEKKKQKIILFSVSCFLFLVVMFAAFIYRSFLAIKRKNIEIAEQKQKIEEKQKEILDSIHYAARIQRSMLPTEKYIDKTLKRLMKNGTNH